MQEIDEIPIILLKLTDSQKRTIPWMPDRAWEPVGGTSSDAVQQFVSLGIIQIVDGRVLFEKVTNSMCELTPVGRTIQEILKGQGYA